MDFKLFTKCEICKKKDLVTRKPIVKLPIGQTAKSQKYMCRKCISNLRKMV